MHVITKIVLIVCCCLFHNVLHAQTEDENPIGSPIAADTGTQPALEQKATSTSQYSSTSEQRTSYDDVYSIEVEWPVAGSVEVKAVEGNEVIITLEKQVRGVDRETALTYLDAVKVEISRVDDILQLKPYLPDAADSITALTRVDCLIESPPDLLLKVATETGNIRAHGIRGDMILTTNTGHVYFNETMGTYRINVREGHIYGRLFLTGDGNLFETQSGSITLVVLDKIAAAMDLTTGDGEITLRLPENYPAEIEMLTKNKDLHAITIDIPAEIETAFVGDVVHGWINEGGPLIRLTAGQRIAILRSKPSFDEPEPDAPDTDIGDGGNEYELIPRPTVDVPKTTEPPVINGDLFEKAWAQAAPLRPFYRANGIDLPNENTHGFLLWDDQYLYIGVRAYNSEMKQVQIQQTEKDSAVWHDDTVEILIDPNPETFAYYHLVINPIGTVFDQIIEDDYPPGAQLADSYEEVADKTWNSRAQVKTQLASTLWSVELAIPRNALESASPEGWWFNLHRKIQRRREYSYWSPTYDADTPWWPHWPEKMGIVQLIDSGNPAPTEGFELAEQIEIIAVEVDGNTDISTPEILQKLPFRPGDVISIDELSWFRRELENLGWFRDVRLETIDAITTDNEPSPVPVFKVNVHIHVIELPTRIAEKLDFRGNRHFSSEFLRNTFGLQPDRISIEVLDTKSQLIANLYKHRGYDLARVGYQFSENDLLIEIDEGHLDDIQFYGNHRIQHTALLDALGFKQGDPYNKQIGASHIEEMREKLRENSLYFKGIKNWAVKQEGDQNVLAIEVEEKSLWVALWQKNTDAATTPGRQAGVAASSIDFDLLPTFDFNRVHGLSLKVSGEATTIRAGTRIFGEVSNGLASKVWDYQVGAEKVWFNRHPLSIGGTVHHLTETNDHAGLSGEEEFLASAALGKAFLDYYQCEGYQAWVEQRLTPSTSIMIELMDEEHNNLAKSTDWSLFNRGTPKRSNQRINTGRLRALAVTYRFDTRDRRWEAHVSPLHRVRNFRTYSRPTYRTRRGWRGNLSAEYTGETLNSDFNFTLYRFRVTRYNRLSSNHHLDFRLEGGFADTPLPRQRLLYLGGVGTLRGYNVKELVGNNMLLFNLEYRLHFGQVVHLNGHESEMGAVMAFLDTGYAWFDDRSVELDRFKTSLGVGLHVVVAPSLALRFEVARALRKGRNTTTILRLSRMF